MAATLREQLQMARINRAKHRVQAWWHANRCEACKVRAAGLAGGGGGGGALVQLLQQLGAQVITDPEEGGDVPHMALPKAH